MAKDLEHYIGDILKEITSGIAAGNAEHPYGASELSTNQAEILGLARDESGYPATAVRFDVNLDANGIVTSNDDNTASRIKFSVPVVIPQ